MSLPVVEITDLALAYRRTRHRVASLKQVAIDSIKRKVAFEQFFALSEVSFTLERGEVLAVIGRNGAGKSTLLKTLARVLPPTRGRVIVRGHVAPMIELSAGFNHELTGAENVVLYGSLLGRSPKEMVKRLGEIGEWADLIEHLDIPLRAYSSGMVARLAFATATDATPDLLLIDEVLSVGDADFREKSATRTASMISGGSAVVLVTHDLETVRNLATRALYLEHGKPVVTGAPDMVIDRYLADLHH